MLKTLIEKEFKAVLLSPRFLGIFAVASVLVLLSIGVGVREYHAFGRAQAAAEQLLNEEQSQATSWMGFPNRVFRDPDPLQIFAGGVHNDVGRLSSVSAMAETKLRQSIYSDDPILAIFRFLDLTFIIQVVLSLFAILLTYDAISGEREQGTLQLAFANPVPRANYLVAKFVGNWLGLVMPLLVPLLLGLLVVVMMRVPMDGDHWGRLGTLLMAGGLYFTFFIALGLAVSALTRHSSTSFLVLLVGWILLVLVIPRAGVLAAVEMVPVPSVAELDSRKEGFERREWEEHRRGIMTKWRDRQAEIDAVPEEEREDFEDTKTWEWMEEDEQERQRLQERITENSRRLNEEVRGLKARQQRVGLALSRLSPASAFQLVALEVGGTGLGLSDRYFDSIEEYRNRLGQFVEEQGGNTLSIRIGHGDEDEEDDALGGGMGDQGKPLDLREMPRYQAPVLSAGEVIEPTLPDIGLLAVLVMGCFAVAFTAFLHYDVRPG
jgi:ABC-type transport system involved in multi-copper enzyme maturation permease subunit